MSNALRREPVVRPSRRNLTCDRRDKRASQRAPGTRHWRWPPRRQSPWRSQSTPRSACWSRGVLGGAITASVARLAVLACAASPWGCESSTSSRASMAVGARVRSDGEHRKRVRRGGACSAPLTITAVSGWQRGAPAGARTARPDTTRSHARMRAHPRVGARRAGSRCAGVGARAASSPSPHPIEQPVGGRQEPRPQVAPHRPEASPRCLQVPPGTFEAATESSEPAPEPREAPTGFSEVSTGFSEPPTGSWEASTGFREASTGFREAPTDSLEPPTDSL